MNKINFQSKLLNLFLVFILIISSTFAIACSDQQLKVENNTTTTQQNEIKNKISEIDKSAQEGKYHYAATMLDLLKTDYDFSEYKDLKQEIDNKRDEYQFKDYSTKSLEALKNKDYNNALSNLVDLVKNYNQKKELKQVCNEMLKDIEKDLNSSKKYDNYISRILLYMTIVSPENKESIKQLYDLNKTYTNEKIDDFEEALILLENSLTPQTTYQNKEPVVGMSKADVENSIWGKPNKINETITANSKHEQWVYSGDRYIYFENSVVTAIQK